MSWDRLKYYILLHSIVVVWGFTGVLGKLVSAPSSLMVWYRILIAALAIAVYLGLAKPSDRIPRPLRAKIFATGLLVGLHWVFFFESIKQSTVSVTMVCLATGPFFVSLLEPLVDRRRLHLHELLLGLVSMIGVGFIFHFEFQHATGIVLGVGAALVSSIFFVLNRLYLVQGADSARITFYEMLGGLTGLTLYCLVLHGVDISSWLVSWKDAAYLVFLGVVCTALAFIGGVAVMKELSPFTAMMTINLEPIYGIILALLVLGDSEYMSPGFYIGGAIVLISIIANGFLKRRFDERFD